MVFKPNWKIEKEFEVCDTILNLAMRYLISIEYTNSLMNTLAIQDLIYDSSDSSYSLRELFLYIEDSAMNEFLRQISAMAILVITAYLMSDTMTSYQWYKLRSQIFKQNQTINGRL